MARNEQLIRQHKIIQILERSRFGRTLDEIRDDLVDELGEDEARKQYREFGRQSFCPVRFLKIPTEKF